MKFKFARTRVWMYYVSEISALPPPFNLIPVDKAAMGCRWIATRYRWIGKVSSSGQVHSTAVKRKNSAPPPKFVKADLDGTILSHATCLRQAYDTNCVNVSCKSNLQLAYDYRVRHEKCRRILKHVLKPYDML